MKGLLALALFAATQLAATASASGTFAVTGESKHWDECAASCAAQGQEFACIDSAAENLEASSLVVANDGQWVWFAANDMQVRSKSCPDMSDVRRET